MFRAAMVEAPRVERSLNNFEACASGNFSRDYLFQFYRTFLTRVCLRFDFFMHKILSKKITIKKQLGN